MIDLDNTFLQNKTHLHFIGIGGSGMFPMVQLLNSKGFHITGSDNNESSTLDSVRKMGIEVFLGHDRQNIEGADLIVYSAAIMEDNPELIAARESGYEIVERGQLLGLITSLYKEAVCISGTHGKTTTTAMITQVLEYSNHDPTAIIGGRLPKINGNAKVGGQDLLICEACEFNDTFLKLKPTISVILNIDEDHLDYFKNLKNIIRSFSTFCDITSNTIIVNGDNKNSMNAVINSEKEIITFGFGSYNDYYADNIIKNSDFSVTYDLFYKGDKISNIELSVVGDHNILNSLACCVVTLALGVDISALKKGLREFKGVSRRFEKLGEFDGITVMDDYAHHPVEIKLTLEALKNLKFKRIWAVFQPFTFSRTAALLDDFVQTLAIADRVVLTDIMGSREKNTYGIHSLDLKKKIENCDYFDSFVKVKDFLLDEAKPGDVIITMGCGDVYKIANMILKEKKALD